MKRFLALTLGFLLLASNVYAAFPAVQTVNYSEETVDTTTHDVLVPTGITAGDLLLLHVSLNGVPTISGMPAGWALVLRGTDTVIIGEIWYKKATGSEANFTYTSSASEQSTNRLWRISGWNCTTAPEALSATGSSANPNSPVLNPANWGTEDTLWFSLLSRHRGNVLVSIYPSSYTDNQFNDSTGTAAGTVQTASASRNVNAASEDPGIYTTGADAQQWVAFTVAVRPGTCVTSRPIAPVFFP